MSGKKPIKLDFKKLEYISGNGGRISRDSVNTMMMSGVPRLSLFASIEKSGLEILTIKEIMEQRVHNWQSIKEDNNSGWNNDFCTNNVIMYHPDGKVKFVINSETLYDYTDDDLLALQGARYLIEGVYDSTNGIEFSYDEIRKICSRDTYDFNYFTIEEVLENPIWLTLVEGDKDLLEEYAYEVNERYSNGGIMPLYLPELKRDNSYEALIEIGNPSISFGGITTLTDKVDTERKYAVKRTTNPFTDKGPMTL